MTEKNKEENMEKMLKILNEGAYEQNQYHSVNNQDHMLINNEFFDI